MISSRVLEFEVESVALHDGRSANVEVELWDCSGNHKLVLEIFICQSKSNIEVIVKDMIVLKENNYDEI